MEESRLSPLINVATTFVVIGIVIGLGLLILNAFSEANINSTQTVISENITGTLCNSTYWMRYNDTSVGCFKDFSISGVANKTDGVNILSGNYTVGKSGYIDTVSNCFTGNGRSWMINYSYRTSTDLDACGAIQDTRAGIATMPDWFEIFIIVLISGIILAIVFYFIPKAKGGGGARAEI